MRHRCPNRISGGVEFVQRSIILQKGGVSWQGPAQSSGPIPGNYCALILLKKKKDKRPPESFSGDFLLSTEEGNTAGTIKLTKNNFQAPRPKSQFVPDKKNNTTYKRRWKATLPNFHGNSLAEPRKKKSESRGGGGARKKKGLNPRGD